MKTLIQAAAGLVLSLAVGGAFAQPYPDKPLRLIVPFSPGGTTDAVARVMAQYLAQEVGQPVAVENKGGGSTIIGTEALARAAPDGYTLMLATPDFTVNPSLRAKLPYDTLKDFTPIALIGTYPMLLVTRVGGMPELERGTAVEIDILGADELTLELDCRYVGQVKDETAADAPAPAA